MDFGFKEWYFLFFIVNFFLSWIFLEFRTKDKIITFNLFFNIFISLFGPISTLALLGSIFIDKIKS